MLIIQAILFNPVSWGQEIIFGTENHAPYNFLDEKSNKIVGLSVDVVHAMLDAAEDTDSKIKMYPWARIYNMALTQKNVAIFSITYTKARDPLFKWVGEIHESKNYLWKHIDRRDIEVNSRVDLPKYKIVVQRNGADHQTLLTEYGLSENLHLVTNTNQRFSLIFNKHGDLFTEAPFTLKWSLDHYDIYDYNLLEKVYFISELGGSLNLAFSDETEDIVVDRYRKALQQIKDNGVHQAIVKKWTE